jgi:hypothetical protein
MILKTNPKTRSGSQVAKYDYVNISSSRKGDEAPVVRVWLGDCQTEEKCMALELSIDEAKYIGERLLHSVANWPNAVSGK